MDFEDSKKGDEMDLGMLLFPDKVVDMSDWKTYEDVFSQSTKTSANTLGDTRIDVHIPYDGHSFITDFQLYGKIRRVNTATGDVFPEDEAGDATSTVTHAFSSILHSAPHLIDEVEILAGNSSGTRLYSIGSSHAYHFLNMILPFKKNSDDYGYWNSHDELPPVGATEIDAFLSSTNADTHLQSRPLNQLMNEGRERAWKYAKGFQKSGAVALPQDVDANRFYTFL